MTSKLGVHIERRPPGWKEFVQRARPAIVKSMDLSIVDEWTEVIDQIGQVLGAEPNIFLLGRLSLAHQPLASPRKAAQDFVRELRKRLPHDHQRRAFDAVEGYNEISYETADQLRALAAFEAEVGRLLKEEGVPFATGGFPTSWPNIPDWVDAFQEALQVADYFHIHEYSWPTMQTKQGGHCLRYRTLYGHMKDANLARPIIISECGLDKPKADDGWQTLQLEDIPEEIREEMLEQHNNEDDIIDAFYLTQLEWYDRELRQDDYVVGATIFTYGGIERWTTFDIHRRSQFRKDLTTYLAAQNTQPHARWTPGAAVTQPPPMPEGPAVRVEQAEITPTRLKPGETLHVTVVVRNIGTVPVNSFNEDNPPDNLFKEMDPVADAASPGTWRVGVDSDGHHHELDHPWRWGWGDPLQPGESRVVQGSIRLYCTHEHI